MALALGFVPTQNYTERLTYILLMEFLHYQKKMKFFLGIHYSFILLKYHFMAIIGQGFLLSVFDGHCRGLFVFQAQLHPQCAQGGVGRLALPAQRLPCPERQRSHGLACPDRTDT